MSKLKDKIYDVLVKKNGRVWYEYERYVREHIEEHHLHRLRHIYLLLKLNWFYRVKKGNTPYLYWDTPLAQSGIEGEKIREESKTFVQKENKKNFESKEEFSRLPIMSLASQLMAYDVISFDMFDTLVFRPFSNPRDLFFVVGEKLDVLDYRKIRIEAENEARDLKQAKYGTREVDLQDIYKIVERKTGIDAQNAICIEKGVEQDLCFANPYMQKVFNILIEQGKEIYITSDMYMHEDELTAILNNCGYMGVKQIIVSCEHGTSKRTGGLYEVLKKKVGNKKIVHIGDNYETDIQSAKKSGIDTRYYKNVNEIGKEHRALGMSDLIGSAYSGIVNAYLYSGVNNLSPYFKYGYVYGGLYILGFCNWIHQQKELYGLDKIVFLSRDGEIYRKIYKRLFPKDEICYLYWSRIANVFSTISDMKANFMNSFIKNKAIDKMGYTAIELLESINLSQLKNCLKKYGLREETVINVDNYLLLEEVLNDNWDTVVSEMSKYEEGAKDVIIKTIGNAKKIAVVDVGWTGTGPLGIKKLVEKKWGMNVEVKCFVAASRVWGHTSNINEITKEVVKPYIFSRMLNRNLYDTHVRTNNNTNNIYFEFFTQAQYPSFGGYIKQDDKVVCKFDIPEVENYKIIDEIHNGITAFCEEYVLRFKKYIWMNNISGYDAYIPYRHAIKNIGYIKSVFANFKFNRGIAGDATHQKLEEMRDIWEKVGI